MRIASEVGCCSHCGGSGFRDVNNAFYEELCFWCGGTGKSEEKKAAEQIELN